MRKKTVIILFLTLPLLAIAAPDKNWEARLSATGTAHSDSGFKEVFSSTSFLPRLELAYHLTPQFGLWAGCSLLSRDGHGPQTQIATHAAQQFLMLGLSWRTDLARRLELRLAAGPQLALYQQDVADIHVSGSALGMDANAALSLALSEALAVDLRLGFSTASGKNTDFDTSITLGGLWAGTGLVVRF